MAPRLLVTGGSGFLGSRLCARAGRAWDLVSTWHSQPPPGTGRTCRLDLRDRDAPLAVLRETRPDIVLHTAYSPREECFDEVIVAGSAAVAEAAAACGATLVHLSTDMVFDGESPPYAEDASLSPVFPYGRAKAAAEERVRAACPHAVIVRPSLLYSLAPPDPRLERNLADARAGRPVVLFHDERRCPAHVDDVAAALLALAERLAAPGGHRPPPPRVLHLPGPQALTRWQFGTAALQALGAPLASVRPGTAKESGLVRPRDLTLAAPATPPELLRPLRPLAEHLAALRR